MQGYDKATNRLIFKATNIAGGMDSGSPPKNLEDNAFTRVQGVDIVRGKGISGPIVGLDAMSIGEIIHRCFYYDGTPNALVMMGMTSAYRMMKPSDSWDHTDQQFNVTPSPAFTDLGGTGELTHHLWSGGSLQDGYGHKLIVCNGTDKPHYYPGTGVFQVMSAAPYMKYVTPGVGRAIGCNIKKAGTWLKNRVEWSAEGDCTDWSSITWGYLDLPNERDTCVAIGVTNANNFYVFRDKSVWHVKATRKGENPFTARPLYHEGIRAQNTLQRLPDDSYMYLGYDDVYRLDERGGKSVGSRIRDELFDTADEDHLPKAWSWLDEQNNRYYVGLVDDGAGTRTAWVYNYEENHWVKHALGCCTFLTRWYGQYNDYF